MLALKNILEIKIDYTAVLDWNDNRKLSIKLLAFTKSPLIKDRYDRELKLLTYY